MAENSRNQKVSNVSTTSLVSQDFGLVWENQPEGMQLKLANEVPVFEHLSNLDVSSNDKNAVKHTLIEGDNLHALYTLQATHLKRIDVIYIDPPYNTGKEFIFNDKIIDLENSYRHSAWLSFMSKRLELAKKLLSEDGTCFISINQHEAPRLWMLLETIFGESNVEVMIWNKVSEEGSAGQGKMKITRRFRNDTEYVFVAYKNKDLVRFNKPAKIKKFKNEYPNSDSDPRGPWISSEICKSEDKSLPHGKNFYTVKTPSGKTYSRQWHVSEKLFFELDSDNRIFWGKGESVPRLKKFVNEPQPSTPTSLINGPSQTDGIRDLEALIGVNKFDNPKPLYLIQHLLAISCKKDSVILDFFAGSGTTLHAVALLNSEDGGNRRCILVTNNENGICRDITIPRIKAALTGNHFDAVRDGLPGELRVFKTNFIARRKNSDRMRTELASHTVDLVCIKEGAAVQQKLTKDSFLLRGANLMAVVATSPDVDHSLLESLARSSSLSGDRLVAYLFTWSDFGVELETVEKWPGWSVEPLPAEMLAQLRKLVPDNSDLFEHLDKSETK